MSILRIKNEHGNFVPVPSLQGDIGPQGYNIGSVSRTSGTGAAGTTDTYTMYLNDTNHTPIGTFEVRNGTNGIDGGQIIQYNTIPTADINNLGKVIQYIGTSTNDYTTGFFYMCVSDGEQNPTYSWERIDVQPGSSGNGIQDIPISVLSYTDDEETYNLKYVDLVTIEPGLYQMQDKDYQQDPSLVDYIGDNIPVSNSYYTYDNAPSVYEHDLIQTRDALIENHFMQILTPGSTVQITEYTPNAAMMAEFKSILEHRLNFIPGGGNNSGGSSGTLAYASESSDTELKETIKFILKAMYPKKICYLQRANTENFYLEETENANVIIQLLIVDNTLENYLNELSEQLSDTARVILEEARYLLLGEFSSYDYEEASTLLSDIAEEYNDFYYKKYVPKIVNASQLDTVQEDKLNSLLQGYINPQEKNLFVPIKDTEAIYDNVLPSDILTALLAHKNDYYAATEILVSYLNAEKHDTFNPDESYYKNGFVLFYVRSNSTTLVGGILLKAVSEDNNSRWVNGWDYASPRTLFLGVANDSTTYNNYYVYMLQADTTLETFVFKPLLEITLKDVIDLVASLNTGDNNKTLLSNRDIAHFINENGYTPIANIFYFDENSFVNAEDYTDFLALLQQYEHYAWNNIYYSDFIAKLINENKLNVQTMLQINDDYEYILCLYVEDLNTVTPDTINEKTIIIKQELDRWGNYDDRNYSKVGVQENLDTIVVGDQVFKKISTYNASTQTTRYYWEIQEMGNVLNYNANYAPSFYNTINMLPSMYRFIQDLGITEPNMIKPLTIGLTLPVDFSGHEPGELYGVIKYAYPDGTLNIPDFYNHTIINGVVIDLYELKLVNGELQLVLINDYINHHSDYNTNIYHYIYEIFTDDHADWKPYTINDALYKLDSCNMITPVFDTNIGDSCYDNNPIIYLENGETIPFENGRFLYSIRDNYNSSIIFKEYKVFIDPDNSNTNTYTLKLPPSATVAKIQVMVNGDLTDLVSQTTTPITYVLPDSSTGITYHIEQVQETITVEDREGIQHTVPVYYDKIVIQDNSSNDFYLLTISITLEMAQVQEDLI